MKLSKKKFKKIISEEINRVLSEMNRQRYWIDPSGGKHEIEGLHIEWLSDNSYRFDSIPDSFDSKDVMDPDYAQRVFFPKGWVNMTVSGDSVIALGTEEYLKRNLDSIVSGNRDKTFNIAVYNRRGEFEDELGSMSSDELYDVFNR